MPSKPGKPLGFNIKDLVGPAKSKGKAPTKPAKGLQKQAMAALQSSMPKGMANC